MDDCSQYSVEREIEDKKLLLIGYTISLLQNVYQNEFQNRDENFSNTDEIDFYCFNYIKHYIGFKFVGIKDDNYEYYIEQFGQPYDTYKDYKREYNDYFEIKDNDSVKYREIKTLCELIVDYLVTYTKNCDEFIRDIIIKLCKNPYPWTEKTVNFIQNNRALMGYNYVITHPYNERIYVIELNKLADDWLNRGELDPEPYRPRRDSGVRRKRKGPLKRKSKVRSPRKRSRRK